MIIKIVLLTSLLLSFTRADSILMIKKGWQLIGLSTALEDMSGFSEENVEEVWYFDAKTQSWLAYSPDSQIQDKMEAKGIDTLGSLKNWHGFWIKSKKEWQMLFPDKKANLDINASNSNDEIFLEKGWNLISLPIDSVVSADIFAGFATWKYTQQNWEVSNDENQSKNFPPIAHIKNSDGIWVKSDKKRTISVAQEAAKLHAFKDKASMENYITEMSKMHHLPWCGIHIVAFGGALEGASVTYTKDSTDSTGTNLQESDVDESDILKHNGKNIFYIGSRNDAPSSINVTSFDALTSKNKKRLTHITLDDNSSIDSFYLVKDRLVVLSKVYSQGMYKMQYDNTNYQNIITIFDVSDITKIQQVAHYTMDGDLVNSRLIGDSLYVVSRFDPKVSISYPKEYLTLTPLCEKYLSGEEEDYMEHNYTKYSSCYDIVKEKNRYYRVNYDNPQVKIEQLLPQIIGTTIEKQALISPEGLYAPSKLNQQASIITLSKFSVSTSEYKKSTGYMGKSHIVYASASSLYVVSSEYPYYMDFWNTRERSMIYKFALDDEVSYKAVGSVNGTALNQFALSEYKGILRIATTDGWSWDNNRTNRLITLKEEQGLLQEEGKLTGLGKKGEVIKSVRFVGDKAYLVTFRNTDPLYTLDLSNPSAPKKVGELEVNGYSAYLHPVGEDKLLGIGQNADKNGRINGVKIELFDVSDFAYPTSLSQLLLGEGTYSELEHNHKALAYRGSDMLFAFPYANYNTNSKNLGIYQIKDGTLHRYKALNADALKGWGGQRGLIFDQNGTSYASFFSEGEVLTQKIIKKDD